MVLGLSMAKSFEFLHSLPFLVVVVSLSFLLFSSSFGVTWILLVVGVVCCLLLLFLILVVDKDNHNPQETETFFIVHVSCMTKTRKIVSIISCRDWWYLFFGPRDWERWRISHPSMVWTHHQVKFHQSPRERSSGTTKSVTCGERSSTVPL